MSITPKVRVHLVVIGPHLLHSPPLVKMCYTFEHISWPHVALHSAFSYEPDVKVTIEREP
jgi:hypothetical protein